MLSSVYNIEYRELNHPTRKLHCIFKSENLVLELAVGNTVYVLGSA